MRRPGEQRRTGTRGDKIGAKGAETGAQGKCVRMNKSPLLQITFSQQNFKRFEGFLATVLTIFTSLCWV